MRLVYLSYTGLLEPLGQSQVFEYLRCLAKWHEVTLISFEKASDLVDRRRVDEAGRACESEGIRWRRRAYHKRPRLIATAWDLLILLLEARRIVRSGRIELLHARGYIPAFAALALKRLYGTPFLFDMRAFWPDEMVTAGRLRGRSLMYRLLKWAEHRCLTRADAVVCLTHASVRHLRGLPPYRAVRFEVIPTCVNLDRFTPGERRGGPAKSDTNDEFVLGCVGTVSSGWFRMDWVMAFFRALNEIRPNSLLRVITRDDPSLVYAEAMRGGVARGRIEVYSRAYHEMANEVRRLDAGVMFFVWDGSKRGSSPTRLGEFLASGVPCVANPGVGDVGDIICRYGVGVLVAEDTPMSMRSAASAVLRLKEDPDVSVRCRHAAEDWFALGRGVSAYDALYRDLTAQGQAKVRGAGGL
jgi:glycosyltransferase involved in cell wall biosynthesis